MRCVPHSVECVALLVRRLGLPGINGRLKYRRVRGGPCAKDRVQLDFERNGPDQRWVTDIVEHPTRERWLNRAVVLDAFPRRIVGWSMGSSPTALPTTSAYSMANEQRIPASGTLIHSALATPLSARSLANRALDSGLAPSVGLVDGCYDNATNESLRSTRPVEVLDRQKWNTRIELRNAILEYIEVV